MSTSESGTEFPDLPAVGELVLDEPSWTYPSHNPTGGTGHLRVWSTEQGHLAMVTDGNVGTSVTNSAKYIWTALVERFGEPLVLLEHYPSNPQVPGAGGLDQVVVLAEHGRLAPHWRRIWPLSPENPAREEFNEWIREHGQALLTNTAS